MAFLSIDLPPRPLASVYSRIVRREPEFREYSFSAPVGFTLGDSGVGKVYGQRCQAWDTSVAKVVHIKDRGQMQFQAVSGAIFRHLQPLEPPEPGYGRDQRAARSRRRRYSAAGRAAGNRAFVLSAVGLWRNTQPHHNWAGLILTNIRISAITACARMTYHPRGDK
jgi:hypothetical protein